MRLSDNAQIADQKRMLRIHGKGNHILFRRQTWSVIIINNWQSALEHAAQTEQKLTVIRAGYIHVDVDI